MPARLLLAALLLIQGSLALAPPRASTPLKGDAVAYVTKAKALWRDHGFPHATELELAIERGEIWGTGDWRPPGYSVFLAVCALGNFESDSLRARVTAAQFIVLAIALWFLFETLLPFCGEGWRPFVLATLVGAPPWLFGFVRLVGPDSLNASFFLIGTLLLWRGRFFTGALVAALTIVLRPEMLALAPVVAGAAWLMSGRRRTAALQCAAAFAIVAAMQFAYRVHFIGAFTLDPFGGLHIADRGAFAWAHSWIGTEQEAYEFVYGLTNGRLTSALPARAFSSEQERIRVLAIVERVAREGYSAEADAAFAQLARERRRASPFRALVLPRLWHAAHLWLNLETNEQLLAALAAVPRSVRRPILGGLLLAKGVLLVAFVYSAVKALKIGPRTALGRLMLLMALVVVGRTILVGLVLDWMTYRYALVAWPHLCGCVAAALVGRIRGPSATSMPSARVIDIVTHRLQA